MEKITKDAYAKVNLGLDVTGRRADGYHLVDMIMQSISLHDTLIFEGDGPREVGPGTTTLVMENGPEGLSLGEDNLIMKAVKVMREHYPIAETIHITLVKRIPMAAGMAGGSTDAAAVFIALRDLYAPDVSDEELRKLALPLGADIPFCIGGGTKRAQGIGEILTDLPDAPSMTLVVAKPPLGVSTPWVYKTLDSREIEVHPDIDALVHALEKKDGAALLAAAGNVLAPVTESAHPIVTEIKEALLNFGADFAMMTGSGPTVFAVTEEDKADAVLTAFRNDPRFAECYAEKACFIDPANM